MGLNRAHRSIENNPHRPRDVAFGEDACRVRGGDAPQVLAATRNAPTRAPAGRAADIAAAVRRFVTRPREALGLISAKPEH